MIEKRGIGKRDASFVLWIVFIFSNVRWILWYEVFCSYRIRRHTDRNPEGATHTFGPTRCKLKMILLQEGPKCYKSLSQLKTLTLLLSSSSCQLISGLYAFSVTMLHILSRKTCFSNAFVGEHTLYIRILKFS